MQKGDILWHPNFMVYVCVCVCGVPVQLYIRTTPLHLHTYLFTLDMEMMSRYISLDTKPRLLRFNFTIIYTTIIKSAGIFICYCFKGWITKWGVLRDTLKPSLSIHPNTLCSLIHWNRLTLYSLTCCLFRVILKIVIWNMCIGSTHLAECSTHLRFWAD